MQISYAEGTKPSTAPTSDQAEVVGGPVDKPADRQVMKDEFQAAIERTREASRYKVRTPSNRQIKRLRQRDGQAQTKKATRNWRRSKIDALQNQATVLGLARVHLLKQGSPAMQKNVTAHVEKLVDQIVVSQDLSHGDAYDTLVEHFRSALELVGEKVPA